MIKRSKFELLLALACVAFAVLSGVAAWLLFTWLRALGQEQPFSIQLGANNAAALFVLTAALLVWLGYALIRFLQAYPRQAERLAEETRLIITSNPAHRIQLPNPPELGKVAQAVNTFADRFQELLQDQSAKIAEARANLEEEKRRLAALMSELTEGVLVCNIEGRILLYNARAKQLLTQEASSAERAGRGGFIGLGRSVFALIDRHSITHALNNLSYRIDQKKSDLVTQFVTTATNGQLIRVRMAPILDLDKRMTGYVLTLEDITRQLETSSRRDQLLQTLTEGIRASVANIRAAIETIEEFPEMDPQRLKRFNKIISDEAIKLSSAVNEAMGEHAHDLKADWQLEDMLGDDLLLALQKLFEDKLGLRAQVEVQEDDLWLKVDSHAVVQAMTSVVREIKQDCDISEVLLRLGRHGRFAAFDLQWKATSADAERLPTEQHRGGDQDGPSVTLEDVAERHGGEVWYQGDAAAQTAYWRLLLPTSKPKPSASIETSVESRPEYYDFDLFHQPGQSSEMDNTPLTELSYTVFDTETTGLNPAAGDEIISIGALRIVNGRLLRHETFERLIDPRRAIPQASVEIHGISPRMLQGQPTIEQVLPEFARFAEDTVLVGHNAAFDMRFLQLKEEQTGITFTNPVLDTLLLAAVAHPNQERQSLEAIANRLGINIIGRHTALGDAIVTAEVLLKLIPLLNEQGIITLRDARTAAEKTFYARISY